MFKKIKDYALSLEVLGFGFAIVGIVSYGHLLFLRAQMPSANPDHGYGVACFALIGIGGLALIVAQALRVIEKRLDMLSARPKD